MLNKLQEQNNELKTSNTDIVNKYTKDYKLSIIPIRPATKEPTVPWKEFQNRILTEQEIHDYFRNDIPLRIGVVCGKISGNLEVIDIDNKLENAKDYFSKFINNQYSSPILDKCIIEETPSGGYHIFYRCDKIEGNQKLALMKKEDKYEAVFETRGEGGYALCAPTFGYNLTHKDFSAIPTISENEREILLSLARSYDEREQNYKPPIESKNTKPDSPWSKYNESERAIEEIKQLLIQAGWKQNGGNNKEEFWLRPGKDAGVSASLRGNSFRVFSTNAELFETEKSYKPASVYALLKYGNGKENFMKAVKDFERMGFGKTEKQILTTIAQVEAYLTNCYDFRNNEVLGKIEYSPKDKNNYKIIEDGEFASLSRELQHADLSYSNDKLNTLLTSDFVRNYDPFKSYFENLPKWDKTTDYIKLLSETVKLQDNGKRDFWEMCLRRWLIGLVACALEPDKTNETALIFYGAQGIGKTKWFNKLFPESLNPNHYLYIGSIEDDKDSKILIANKLIINLDELGSLKKDEIGYLKSLFSLTQVSLREPYMRKGKTYPRRASFVGSIDTVEFLSDMAGTRRFLTFSVADVDYQHNIDMDKVYSQAYALFKNGDKYYFTGEEIVEINTNNEQFRTRSYEEEKINELFCPPTESNRLLLTSTEIAEMLAGNSSVSYGMKDTLTYRITNSAISTIGKVMTRLKYKRISVRKDNKSPVYKWEVGKNDFRGNL
ncbi:MAG TPA: VapE family protein [Candidatus Kapabacteria bacterium]|nr:VapE family protein [Candidatus Kapabacteria bacterium]